MKKILCILVASSLALASLAQPGKKSVQQTPKTDSIVLKGTYVNDTAEHRFITFVTDADNKSTGWIGYTDGYVISTYLVDTKTGSAIPVKEAVVDSRFTPIAVAIMDRKRLNWSAGKKG